MPFTLPALRGRGASARGGAPNQTVRCSSCPLSRPAGSGRGALLKAAVAAPPLERGVSFDGLPLLQELPRSNAVAAPTPDRKPIVVRIDDEWFDLSGWRAAHPGAPRLRFAPSDPPWLLPPTKTRHAAARAAASARRASLRARQRGGCVLCSQGTWKRGKARRRLRAPPSRRLLDRHVRRQGRHRGGVRVPQRPGARAAVAAAPAGGARRNPRASASQPAALLRRSDAGYAARRSRPRPRQGFRPFHPRSGPSACCAPAWSATAGLTATGGRRLRSWRRGLPASRQLSRSRTPPPQPSAPPPSCRWACRSPPPGGWRTTTSTGGARSAARCGANNRPFFLSPPLLSPHPHALASRCIARRPSNFGGWAAGFGATMWSEKHNRHHALTNEVGQDEDLSGGPVLFLWAPDPARDTAWRRAQGAYFQAAFALLHLVWRWDSFLIALRGRPPAPPPHPPLPVAAPLAAGGPAGLESPRVSAPAAVSPAPPRRPRAAPLWRELVPILGHYLAFLAVFPLPTFVGGVLLGGWIMANVVTTSHQSEELLMEPEHDWVLMQFRTTRDAEPAGPLMSWLWGGMQHQLEHHLFPTMPRSKYADLVPVIKAFASEHGLPYKSEGVGAILVRNWNNYARVAAAPAVPGAKAPRKGVTL